MSKNMCLMHNIPLVKKSVARKIVEFCPKCEEMENPNFSKPEKDNYGQVVNMTADQYQEQQNSYTEINRKYSYRIENDVYTLKVKPDVLAFELWNVFQWIDFVNHNPMHDHSRYHSKAVELGIVRHFELAEV